jgi:hypothetical protein
MAKVWKPLPVFRTEGKFVELFKNGGVYIFLEVCYNALRE